MGVRDWPSSVKSAVRWSLFLFALAISFWPIPFLFAFESSGSLRQSWLQILGGYATLITAPIACATAVAVSLKKEWRGGGFRLQVVRGAAIGVVVGIVLSLVTGGYSMISAPSVALVTFVLAWLIRRPDRDAPNPPTAAP